MPTGSPVHLQDPDEVLRQLGADAHTGLTDEEAARRLEQQGPNQLAEAPPASPWVLFANQFRGTLVLVLVAAAGLAFAIGDTLDALVILLVVFINGLLGFYQEYRAEQSLAALKKMLAPEARVRRNGQSASIPAAQLVTGDMVLLEAGDRVPADGRIVRAHHLQVDESSLTGESHTTGKQTAALDGDEIPLAERTNMLYLNTSIARGRAEMVVTDTGMATETGRLAGMLAAAEEEPTPLQVQLDGLGKRLAMIAGIVVIIMLAGGLMRGEPWVQLLMTAIALAVAAIPEGLPAVVTVTLAIGLNRMARQRAIVKRLAAVETLGCTTVICSDKTGTLTVNQMTARALYFQDQRFTVSGEGYDPEGGIQTEDDVACPDLDPLLLPLLLCNDARLKKEKNAGSPIIGDPMEAALVVLAAKGGMDQATTRARLPRIAEIPFDTAHKYMASFHRQGDTIQVLVKGAPETLLNHASTLLTAEGEAPLDEAARARLQQANEQFARTGLRVLAAARGSVPADRFDPSDDLFPHIENLQLVGLVGLMDPPRPEARQAINLCGQAGIDVKMITGDQPVTAGAIAEELGLTGEVVGSQQLARMEDSELASRINGISVFARATPEQKVRIVRALKAGGHVVAMTGDGINDAPALKSADIGVAMGLTGTDVTREAATMVLTDDNFATIVGAVKEGRTIYQNIIKFVRFQLSTNIGAILCVFMAPLAGLPLPFNPIQLLWVNIIMDGPPAMALGLDPPQPGIMKHRPRQAGQPVLSLRRLSNLMGYGLVMMLGTLGVLYWGLQNGSVEWALTLAFTTFVLFQVFNAFNARADQSTSLNRTFFHNRVLWFALGGVISLQYLAVHWQPAQLVFHTTGLSGTDWLIAVTVASSVWVLEECRKWILTWFR